MTKPLKIREAAELLGLGYETVRSEIVAGRLRASKFRGTYRIEPADLAAYREAAVIGERAPRPKLATGGPSAFKKLDGARTLAAWRERGVRLPSPGGRNAPSSESSSDPSVPPGS